MKSKFFILIFGVLAIVIVVMNLPVAKTAPSAVSVATTTQQAVKPRSVVVPSTSSSTVVNPPPEDIPIEVQALTPETAANDFSINASSAEEETCCQADFMEAKISQFDPNVPPRTSVDQNSSESGWTTILNDGPYYIYLTAIPPGSICGITDDSASCPNATLKVFNSQDNSVATIATGDFTKAAEAPISHEQILYLKSDNAILVMGRDENAGKFTLYNPTGKYAFKSVNTSSSYALLIGDALAIFDSASNKLSVEDLVGHTFNECTVTDPSYQTFFAKNFNASNTTLSPDGRRLAIFGDKLVWMNISDWGNASSANCLDGARTEHWIKSVSKIGNTSLAVFNRLYHTNIDLGYKGFSMRTEVVGNTANFYVLDPSQKKSLIKSYKLRIGDYGPATWMQIFKDENQDNRFYLLVSDDYTERDPMLRQIVEVIINK